MTTDETVGGNPVPRIDWLIWSMHDAPLNGKDASSSSHPNEPAFLSPAERLTYKTLRVEKRRREWLLGRWTAKQLLRRSRAAYHSLPLTAITVGRDPDGAPYLAIDADPDAFGAEGKGKTRTLQRLPICLSISHRGDRAFCVLSDTHVIGADIECVEARHPAFVRDFFTASENARVWASPDGVRDTLITTIWSAKESMLKVLREGLRLDTRRVEVTHVGGIEAVSPAARRAVPAKEWHAVQVHCTLPGSPICAAWWRPDNNDVLTLAMALGSSSSASAAQKEIAAPCVSITAMHACI